jgi:hypothetical protein
MRKIVEWLIVSKFFFFSNLFMSFCICCLRSCKLIRDAMKNDLETSFRRSRRRHDRYSSFTLTVLK